MEKFQYNLAELEKAAVWLIDKSRGRNIIAFSGDMGAGKTTLITEICRQLGVTDEVSSPTFSLVNEYSAGSQTIYHFDFYRIRHLQEAYDLGYEEYFYGDALCLVEWPEKIASLLPEETLKVSISLGPQDSRVLTLS